MAKSSPERLAAALRANLQRRKQAKTGKSKDLPPTPVGKPHPKPAKTGE